MDTLQWKKVLFLAIKHIQMPNPSNGFYLLQFGNGTSGSHWEKRLLMNEIMTGSVDTRSVVSKMTLALLEAVDGTMLITVCQIVLTGISGCTYNREAEGYCCIVSYSRELPQSARYFPEANKGAQSSLVDYCTYFVAYSDGSCTATNSARAPDRMLGEMRGSSSRCMASSLVRSGFVRGSTTQGNGCYQHRCVNNTLEVAVDGIWKVCPESGGPVTCSMSRVIVENAGKSIFPILIRKSTTIYQPEIKQLEPGNIQIKPSMIKIEIDQTLPVRQTFNSLKIVDVRVIIDEVNEDFRKERVLFRRANIKISV
ncbi:unnamed protein product [Fraxinus pennsylvanica]|uniref:Uncharacterized protein n=1 Tax=Fraxinus pennsylvanica TaxID=56036 RepID=A0AAD1ZQZ0_9LAMI|nr:unnamed protein product [Fraxinus pennsylvanica]